VHFGEVDSDGRDEVIFVSHPPTSSGPEAAVLTIVHLDAAGREEGREVRDLGTAAAWWDIQGGILGVGGAGPLRFDVNEPELLVAAPSPLAALGPTTPAPADVAHDLDGDGVAEVIHVHAGTLRATSVDGTSWEGFIPLQLEGELSARDSAGGGALRATVQLPPVVVADVDGDGLSDVILPQGRQARVYFSDVGRLAVRSSSWQLPVDLDPTDDPTRDKTDGERRELEKGWFTDVDGDGKADLLVHSWVVDGSWFGATAEILFARGTGSGLGSPQVLRTEAAAVDVRQVDFDGDGDLDLLVPQVDLGLGQLGRALVSRTIKVDVSLYVMEGDRYRPDPLDLGRLDFPIEESHTQQQELQADVTGDGIVDYVTNDGEQQLSVYPGHADGVSEEPLHTLPISLPPGDDVLATHDLTGDGRAEILVWGPDAAQGTVLRWQ